MHLCKKQLLDKMIWLLVLLLVPVQTHIIETPHNITSNPCTDRNHLFLAPGVLTAGGTSRACVSRFHPDGPARMLLTLHTDDGEVSTATRDLPPGDGGCLDINVPLKPNSKAELSVNMRYPEANCAWSGRLRVRVAGARLLALHTERARYRPGDTVRVRALALRPDLTPAHGTIDEIWMEGPRGIWDGVRAAQWLHVRTRLGLAQIQYQLDEQAPPGKWLVAARLADGSQGSATFSVGNYELPPFQLTVRHAPKVLRTSERLVWTVCVRYPWSEAVEGMLVIRLRGAGGTGGGGAGGGGAGGAGGGVRTAVRLRAPRACHRHAVAARRVALATGRPHVVVADFSFQEDGTRVWQNTTVVSHVVEHPVTLDFLTKYRAVISPGLPYKLKIKATRWDDKPAANEQVRVCRTARVTSQAAETCVDAVTDVRGIAVALFRPEEDDSPFYNFEARLQNATASLSLPRGETRAALGALREARARSLLPLYVRADDVRARAPLTVHFVVLTRTGTIYRWGATTQCPAAGAGSQVLTTSRDADCLSNPETLATPSNDQKNLSDVDSLLDGHLLRVMLPIKVSSQMCPDSRVVAYFYHNDELISASKYFEMDECFGNKVEASWVSRQVAPGSPATLQLTTPGPALCALSVLDTAAQWVQPADSIRDVLMLALRKLVHLHRNLTEHDAAGECFLSMEEPSLPASGAGLLRGWLAAGGVRAAGAGGEPCPAPPSSAPPAPAAPAPAALLADDVYAVRTDFSEPRAGGVRAAGAGGEPCPSPPSSAPPSSAPPAPAAPAPAALLADDVYAVRTDFSEAWLWRLVAVGSNGSATVSARAPDAITRYEASAYCLSRAGLAIAQPAVLQVFRDFFIHADGPRRLRRGERSVLRYRLFNYLYTTLCVDIQILTDPHVEGGGSEARACVAGRAAAARRLELRARLSGEARVRVRAQARNRTDSGGAPVSDEVLIKIQIDPEGVPVQEYKSIMLCASGTEGASAPPAVSWRWARGAAVPGTETLRLWAAGDVMGPLLADADALVSLPRGCGEQNMARLATALLARALLPPAAAAAAAATDHVARGLTRQLQYAHPAGGFSAFGARDAQPSTWLTAFCLRYMRRAYQAVWPGRAEPPALARAERWLRAQHMENGCFRNDGQLFHRDLTGGLGEESKEGEARVALTAYVVAALLAGGARVSPAALADARACLRAATPATPARPYAHALLTYAIVTIARYEEELRRTNEAALLEKKTVEDDEESRYLVELLKMAKHSGDYVWWEGATLSSSIEATGYALLALAQCGGGLRAHCAAAARAAALWLHTQRSPTGGFVATQDTLVALEGLARWAGLPAANLTVRARGRALTLAGAKLPEYLPVEPADQLDVEVEGEGCALVQATRSYHTLEAAGAGGAGGAGGELTVQVSVHTDGPFDCSANDTFCYCAAVVQACVVWAGRLPEMALLEVLLPGGYGADAARLYRQLDQPDTLLRRIELSAGGGKATLYLSGGEGQGQGERAGHRCYAVHATGPRLATAPQRVTVFDYYAPHLEHTQMYVIPEDCPAAISHETGDYNPTDNLFNKAKSLDDGEILISHDFSFEDIPDGVPLDDPMYENLTQKKYEETGVNVHNKLKNENYEKQPEGISAIAFTVVENHVRGINNSRDDLKQIRQNESITETNITQGAVGATSDIVFAKYSDNEIQNAANNIKYKIPVSQFTENATEKCDIVQNDETIPNVKSDLQMAVAETNKVNAKYTVGDDEGNLERTTEKTEKLSVDNPLLSEFHVIDSERDLEVPSGVEGPAPAAVLPPGDFVFVAPDTGIPFRPHQAESWRQFPRLPPTAAYGEPSQYDYRSYTPQR